LPSATRYPSNHIPRIIIQLLYLDYDVALRKSVQIYPQSFSSVVDQCVSVLWWYFKRSASNSVPGSSEIHPSVFHIMVGKLL